MKSFRDRLVAVMNMCALLLVIFPIGSSANMLVMPRELVDFAVAHGCTQFADFYDKPGMVKPPYVYGWIPGGDEDSAVFWCKKVERTETPYELMFKVQDPSKLGGCPAVIEWKYPRGLSITTRRNLSLQDFRYVNAPQQRGPATVIASARVIVNEYDGLMDVFYCHQGRWLVASYE